MLSDTVSESVYLASVKVLEENICIFLKLIEISVTRKMTVATLTTFLSLSFSQ